MGIAEFWIEEGNEFSQTKTPRQLNIVTELIVDWKFQVRNHLVTSNIQYLKGLYRKGVEVDPVMVGEVDGNLYLLDGFHRVEALKMLERTWVNATVLLNCDVEDALWIAAKANLKTHQKLTLAEREKVFKVYMETNQWFTSISGRSKNVRSAREIAVEVPYSKSTVLKKMEKHFPDIYQKHYREEKVRIPEKNRKNSSKTSGFMLAAQDIGSFLKNVATVKGLDDLRKLARWLDMAQEEVYDQMAQYQGTDGEPLDDFDARCKQRFELAQKGLKLMQDHQAENNVVKGKIRSFTNGRF